VRVSLAAWTLFIAFVFSNLLVTTEYRMPPPIFYDTDENVVKFNEITDPALLTHLGTRVKLIQWNTSDFMVGFEAAEKEEDIEILFNTSLLSELAWSRAL
jgi:hypothetical protein